jgi:glycosyltransferase involved in cell wall biosynthesis
MKIAFLTTDNREFFRSYSETVPHFASGPEALIHGFATMPELEVHVVSCTQKQMKSPEKLAENIFFHSLYVPKIGWMRTLYQGCIRAVRQKLKAIKPDLVHGQGTERDCAISAIFSRFPNVVTIHGNMAELARLFKAPIGSFGWLAGQLENATLKRTGGVVCGSAYTENLVQPRAAKTWRVPHPIRQVFFDAPRGAARTDKCVVVNIGWIQERKRQVKLLGVARRLHEQGLEIEFQFIGPAPNNRYVSKFLELVREAETQGYAKYLGMISTAEVISSFDAAHGLVHFPNEEAFGSVVPEAMARELAFFGAQVGGIVDICDGVPCAKLFEGEDWDGLATGLAEWIRSGYPKSTGAAEIMKARYHPRIIAQRHLEIYCEVVESRSRSNEPYHWA